MGLLQGLTEFLPVSSSGHLELGKALLNINPKNSLIFTLVVHGATVLSTIVVFRKEIWELIKGLFAFKWNEETKYIAKIIVSMIPVGIVGVFFKDEVESFFNGNIAFVGAMLLVTAALLAFTYFKKSNTRNITFSDSFIIGISQAIAVLPGISRSGATIAAGLLLGVKREDCAKFSFLLSVPAILGAAFLELDLDKLDNGNIPHYLAGGFMAFIVGFFALLLLLKFVKKGRLWIFSIWVAFSGVVSILI